jgi:hypothetical protein
MDAQPTIRPSALRSMLDERIGNFSLIDMLSRAVRPSTAIRKLYRGTNRRCDKLDSYGETFLDERFHHILGFTIGCDHSLFRTPLFMLMSTELPRMEFLRMSQWRVPYALRPGKFDLESETNPEWH